MSCFVLHPSAPVSNRSAAIVGEPTTSITVTINSPTTLHCYAMGWPRPFVTWWRGDRMLPFSSEDYEQDSDYTLLIRSVTISNLGVYECQAYNAIDRPASWSITLLAIGPVHNVSSPYIVPPPERPTTIRPNYPFRPQRTQAPDYQTYTPVYPNRTGYYVPDVIPLDPSRNATSRYQGEGNEITFMSDVINTENIFEC